MNAFTEIMLSNLRALPAMHAVALEKIEQGASPAILQAWWDSVYQPLTLSAHGPSRQMLREAYAQVDWAEIHARLQETAHAHR